MVLFASELLPGSNPYAIYLEAVKCGIPAMCADKNGTIGHVDNVKALVANNGRLMKDNSAPLKVNTQHGNFFLGDSCDEKYVNLYVVASQSEKNMMIRNGTPEGKIKITGCARTDRLFENNKSDIDNFRSKFNIQPDKKIILYAPTYDRSAFGFGKKLFFAQSLDIADDRQMLLQILQGAEDIKAQLVIRVHKYYKRTWPQLVPPWLMDLVSNKIPVSSNETDPDSIPSILASDILITDFSSIVADFLPLNKQIIFMEPNNKWRYTDKWHATLEERNQIGEIVLGYDTIKDAIVNASDKYKNQYSQSRKSIIQKYVPLFDGQCAKRCVETIIDEYNKKFD